LLTSELDEIRAALYASQRRYAEAEPLYKRALAIDEKALPDHPNLANDLHNLARLYVGQGRDADAEALHSRSWQSARRCWVRIIPSSRRR
jgi:tetratricopeptide (TPR) repeat protein